MKGVRRGREQVTRLFWRFCFRRCCLLMFVPSSLLLGPEDRQYPQFPNGVDHAGSLNPYVAHSTFQNRLLIWICIIISIRIVYNVKVLLIMYYLFINLPTSILKSCLFIIVGAYVMSSISFYPIEIIVILSCILVATFHLSQSIIFFTFYFLYFVQWQVVDDIMTNLLHMYNEIRAFTLMFERMHNVFTFKEQHHAASLAFSATNVTTNQRASSCVKTTFL